MTPMIDKLKICYTLSSTSRLKELREYPLDVLEFPDWDFRLRRIDGKHFSFMYEIVYIFNKGDSLEDMEEQVFGTIQWGLRSDRDEAFKPYVWLYVDNSQFYLKYDYSTNGRLMYLGYIEQMLGLVFNNITHLDLALDTTINFSKVLIKMIRNKDYYPIINGTKITDRKKLIEDILYIGVGNLERIREYSLLLQNKKNDLSLNAYNKKREIENKSKKYYVMESYGSPRQLYRLEVRINSDVMKDFFARNRIEYNPSMFITDDWLWLLYLTFLNRLIRFQSTKGRKVYGVLDLI